MIIHEMEQGSPEWLKLKEGKFSATDFQTIANGKPKTIETLIYKKAAQIITGRREETYSNANMERGIELENEAREAFIFEKGLSVRQVGFVQSAEHVGCSPDGLIGDDSGLEIKCPEDHTHARYLIHSCNAYHWQLQASMYVTGRESWWFCSYNPNFPIEKQLYIKECFPDLVAFEKIKTGLNYAVKELLRILEELK